MSRIDDSSRDWTIRLMLDRTNSEAAPEFDQRAAEPAGFDPREVLNFAWRQWKFIAGVTILAILLGAVNISRQIPMYTASAQLLLEPPKTKAVAQDVVQNDMPLDLPTIESQIAIIKSTSFLRRVVTKEKLVNDSEFGSGPDGAGAGLLSAIKGFFNRTPQDDSKASDIPAEAGLDALPPEVIGTIENIKGAINVSRSGQALVLNVSFTSADRNKAARLANAIANAYVVDKLDARFEAAKRASTWLSDRLVELKQQLRDSEEAVAQFRSQNNLTQAGPATLSQEQLSQLNGRLVAARAETAEKRARLELLQRVQSSGGNISALPDVVNSGAIADLRKQENDISRQEADMLARYSDRYPAVVNLRAQRADIRRAIAGEVARLTNNIKNEYELAKARQEAVEKTLREVSGQTDEDSTKVITLRELERTAAVNKSLFEDFLQRSKVTQEQSTFEARDARVISPAQPPGVPSSPKTGQIMMMSALLGLLAGIGGSYLLEMMNAGFTTPRQIEDTLGLPLLASLSKMETRDLTADGAVLTIPQYPFVKPLSRFSEAIRSLRSAVMMSDVDHPPKVIQATSTVPGEGKSTVCLTLASSAAQSGQRVLLIDCDLRHPTTSRYFQAEKSPGLVDYLAGGADLQTIITFNESLRLWVLPAGAKTQNPPDLLGSEKLKLLLEALRAKFDLIVVDTPPLGPVVDPLIVSQLVDKIVFVVRWASTPREMIVHSIQRLSGHRKVAGVVFNYVVDAQAQKYGKYAYSYYYGNHYYKKYYHE
ncbi:exopolysaccharide transport family protein [Rhodoblastus acidophilus]|uniref:GumC family protein n=1 Tax=Rhodoblastus acidophilus TaxID=1074 RepID=UPI002225A295|nr:polysaccharide biosynthesis tyrosine autokinase [Rhodoblastus acidophilus]MCW2284305.1 exopolysaccharide transport family protein [Rhodoblastus acidophilus]MCW2333217.1 exopolysaccharide transport family protein [Rhodoblastus acidophilus]